MEHQKGSSTQLFSCAVPVELQAPEPQGREEVRQEKVRGRQVLADAPETSGTCSNRTRNPRNKRRWLVKLRCFDEYKIQAHPMLKQVLGTRRPAKVECHFGLAVYNPKVTAWVPVLCAACKKQNRKLAELLLAHGADPNAELLATSTNGTVWDPRDQGCGRARVISPGVRL